MSDEPGTEQPLMPAELAMAGNGDEPEVRSLTTFERVTRSTAFWIGTALLAMVIIFGVISPNNAFLRPSNLLTIGLNAAQIMILAVGMTYLIGAGQLDLSIGSNLILCSVFSAQAVVGLAGSPQEVASGEYPNLVLATVVAVGVALLTGATFGLINGLLVTRLRITSFIVTLATGGIGLGIALVRTGGGNVANIPRDLQLSFGSAKFLDLVPYPLIVAAIVAAILWAVMRLTGFGLRTVAIGSSPEAAVRAGVAVDRHLVKLFLLMGLLVGVAGLLDVTRFATTNVAGHQTDALAAIAAVVIGGSSLFGGVASVGGTILGTLIPVSLATGLVIMRVESFYQLIAVGIILILAVYWDQRRRTGMS
jgi:ribose transport system permease protein